MVVASIILLIESVGVFFNEGYAISVAVIAMLLALGALVMTYKMQDKWNSMGKVSLYEETCTIIQLFIRKKEVLLCPSLSHEFTFWTPLDILLNGSILPISYCCGIPWELSF